MVGRDSFTRVGAETALMDSKFTLAGLKEGSSHEFRVSAVNQVGQGKPSFATKPVQCKDELGEFSDPMESEQNCGRCESFSLWEIRNPDSLLCPPLEPPVLDLDFRDKMMVKVGDTCTLAGRYSGKPAPGITWTKNDEELKADEEIFIHSTARHLSLSISKAKREHSGCYRAHVENAAGSRTGTCTVTVVGESERVEMRRRLALGFL